MVSYTEVKSQGFHRQETDENLVIGIIWIGHTLNPDNKRQ